jgi:hypothetical protein
MPKVFTFENITITSSLLIGQIVTQRFSLCQLFPKKLKNANKKRISNRYKCSKTAQLFPNLTSQGLAPPNSRAKKPLNIGFLLFRVALRQHFEPGGCRISYPTKKSRPNADFFSKFILI